MKKHYRNRPPQERLGHQMTVGLNDSDAEILERLARATGRTKVEAMRLAIRELYTSMKDALKEQQEATGPDPNPNRPPVVRENDHLPPIWLDVELVAWMITAHGEAIQPTQQQIGEAGGQLCDLIRGSGFPLGAFDLLETLKFVWLVSARNGIQLNQLIPRIAEAMRRHSPATTRDVIQ